MTRPVPQGTPFLHVAAATGIWYALIIAANTGATLAKGTGWGGVMPALIVGGILFVIATPLMWLFLMRKRLGAWALVPLAVPIYLAVALVISAIVGGFRGVYLFLLSQM
ncbi:hypothetical protein [Lentzea kentuckyensis]|uniref:hypothetical protein n=1 Tax=Lentzea kentuckyensis TaxID=360086 RepID=UPI00117A9BC5|nr:hypothetical protein [Lentzea kentuckyensis]